MNNSVEINGLVKKYPSFTLGPLDFHLPKGSIVGLIGENGAGKTTLIKSMLGIHDNDEGNIRILGEKPSKTDKNSIGIVLDEAGFPLSMNAKNIGKMLSLVYNNWNADLFDKYISDLSIPRDKTYKDLSKGTKMKLAIATSLSHDPQLLILDEATSGLDPVVRDDVLNLLSEFTRNEEHSIVISSHIVSDLEKICDYIAFLHKGRLMLFEEKDRLYEQYVMIQCEKDVLDHIAKENIIGKKETPFGVEAVIRKSVVPSGVKTTGINIEELFIFMSKGEIR